MSDGGDDPHDDWYVTNAHSISPVNWDVANILNSASRVSVPLFFMISGFLFFGERSAQPRHFIRIAACLGFYSAVALIYITLFTSISPGLSLKYLLQKPVFYHLWFFLRHYRYLPGITVDSGKKRQRKDASGADGGDRNHRQSEYRLTENRRF